MLDGKAVSAPLKPLNEAWCDSGSSDSVASSSSSRQHIPVDRFVCEVLIRRSQDEECMVSVVLIIIYIAYNFRADCVFV